MYNFSVLPALEPLLRGPAGPPKGRGRRITNIRFIGDSITRQSVPGWWRLCLGHLTCSLAWRC